MSEAPKIPAPSIIRERLRLVRPSSASSHPDANLLSALAENTLSTAERTQVLAHLAACDACRDVLALALPESEPVALVPTPSPRFALRWVSARWMALVATAAVLVAAVVVYRVQPVQERSASMVAEKKTAVSTQPSISRQAETSSNVAKPISPAVDEKEPKDLRAYVAPASGLVAETKTQVFAKQAAIPKSQGEYDRTTDREGVRDDNKLATISGGSAAKRIISPQQQIGQLNADNVAVAQNVPAEAAKKADSTEANAIAEAFSVSPRDSLKPGTLPSANTNLYTSARAAAPPNLGAPQPTRNARTAMAKAAPPAAARTEMYSANAFSAPAPSAPASTSETVEVTGEAPALQTQNANLMHLDAGKAKSLAAPLPAASRWRVHKGRVQESPDGGASWSDVTIARAVSFHQVSAAGDQVWAGGSNAVLYHSSDGGQTWAPQWSYARDGSAKAEYRYPKAPARITEIRFDDALHGQMRVKVRDKEPQEFLFISNDGGQTWLEETVD